MNKRYPHLSIIFQKEERIALFRPVLNVPASTVQQKASKTGLSKDLFPRIPPCSNTKGCNIIKAGPGEGSFSGQLSLPHKKNGILMTEIVLDVPDDLPLPGLIERLNTIIAEEHLRWMLFIKSVDVISLDDKDMTALEGMRDETWKEKKKLFGL